MVIFPLTFAFECWSDWNLSLFRATFIALCFILLLIPSMLGAVYIVFFRGRRIWKAKWRVGGSIVTIACVISTLMSFLGYNPPLEMSLTTILNEVGIGVFFYLLPQILLTLITMLGMVVYRAIGYRVSNVSDNNAAWKRNGQLPLDLRFLYRLSGKRSPFFIMAAGLLIAIAVLMFFIVIN